MIRINSELSAYANQLYLSADNAVITQSSFSPKEKIIDQGKRVFSAYIIKSGMAKCFLREDNGTDFIQEFFSKGEVFGEIEVMNENLSFCSIEAITLLKVYQIKAIHFHELLEKDRKFNRLILQSLANKVRYKSLRHAHNQSHSIEENLLRIFNEFPALLEKISKQDIANYLGITLRSLNRTLNDLIKRGSITM